MTLVRLPDQVIQEVLHIIEWENSTHGPSRPTTWSVIGDYFYLTTGRTSETPTTTPIMKATKAMIRSV